MNMKQDGNVRNFLLSLSNQDFLNVGMHQIAYIRPVTLDEQRAFSIHAADGTPISVTQSFDTAVAAIRHNEMHPVTLH